MSIDITTENLLSLTDAAKRLPKRRGGKKVHTSTLYRWCVSGCRGVLLEFTQIGGTKCTSLEALERFADRLTRAASEASQPASLPRSFRQRRQASDMAAKLLERDGV